MPWGKRKKNPPVVVTDRKAFQSGLYSIVRIEKKALSGQWIPIKRSHGGRDFVAVRVTLTYTGS